MKIAQGIDIWGLFWLNSLFLFILHGWFIIKYRRKHKTTGIAHVAWAGAVCVSYFQFIVVPFLISGLYGLLDLNDIYLLDELTRITLVRLSIVSLVVYIPVALLFDYIMKKII